MAAVGRVRRVGPQGLLVIETEEEPVDPGTRCSTEDGTPVGVVQDVIGPVDGPFLVVDPDRGPKAGSQERPEALDALIGTALYPR